MKIVCISDTHHGYGASRPNPLTVPDGDVLVFSGDATFTGTVDEVAAFNSWLRRQPHETKVVVPGNHDWLYQRNPDLARSLTSAAKVLVDEGMEVGGIKIWGSPWQPEFNDWAFNLPRGEALAEKWTMVPCDTDLLVTHGPPMGIGDLSGKEHVGCSDLMERVEVVKPRWHAFGHVHEGYGVYRPGESSTTFINASVCNWRYEHVNKAITVDTETGIVG